MLLLHSFLHQSCSDLSQTAPGAGQIGFRPSSALRSSPRQQAHQEQRALCLCSTQSATAAPDRPCHAPTAGALTASRPLSPLNPLSLPTTTDHLALPWLILQSTTPGYSERSRQKDGMPPSPTLSNRIARAPPRPLYRLYSMHNAGGAARRASSRRRCQGRNDWGIPDSEARRVQPAFTFTERFCSALRTGTYTPRQYSCMNAGSTVPST